MLTFKDHVIGGVRLRVAFAGGDPESTETGRPTLLLIHGFAVSHKEWLPTIPHLASRFRCIIPDLPGFGGSEKVDPSQYGYRLSDFARTLVELLDQIGLGRVHVCGHSMGGSIALAIGASYPDRVERLSVIDPGAYPSDLPLKGRLPMIKGVGPIVFKHLYRRALFLDYFKNDVFSGHDSISLARVEEYYRDFTPAGSREAAYAALLNFNDLAPLVRDYPKVRAHTLILWGSEDRIFPASDATRLGRALRHAYVEVIAGACHAPNEEFPERVAELIAHHHLVEGVKPAVEAE